MGSADGAIRTAARRVGVAEVEYRQRTAAGWKWCSACRDWRRRNAFSRDSSRGDGLKSRCQAHETRRATGPSKPERQAWAAAGLAWCRACPAWHPSDDVVPNGLCREHAREAAREWYANGGWRSRQGRSAARRRKVAQIGPDTREWIFEDTGGLCAYDCGRQATSIDHVIPVALGGETVPGNIVPACGPCNSAKRDADPLPWIARMTEAAFDLIAPGLRYDGALLDWLDMLEAS